MCDFISWIEETDANGETLLLYLTDAEVFSKDFRNKGLLKTCKGSGDALGHGAIRDFYDLRSEVDEDREEIYFWITKNLPKKIAGKIKKFDDHWGKMFKSGFFPNEDLVFIIMEAPSRWKEKAWNQLLNQKPGDFELLEILEDAPAAWKERTWNELVKRKLNKNQLRSLILCDYPYKYSKRAFDMLLQRKNIKVYLREIQRNGPIVFMRKAEKALQSMNQKN